MYSTGYSLSMKAADFQAKMVLQYNFLPTFVEEMYSCKMNS